jgi:hypothetical protein
MPSSVASFDIKLNGTVIARMNSTTATSAGTRATTNTTTTTATTTGIGTGTIGSQISVCAEGAPATFSPPLQPARTYTDECGTIAPLAGIEQQPEGQIAHPDDLAGIVEQQQPEEQIAHPALDMEARGEVEA